MKKTIIALIISLIVLSVNGQSYKIDYGKVLDEYVLDGDTTLYYPVKHDYRWYIQYETSSLSALDATIGIKQKKEGSRDFVYITNDTTSNSDGASKFTIDCATCSEILEGFNALGDSIAIELKNNSVATGTVSLYLNMYDNR